MYILTVSYDVTKVAMILAAEAYTLNAYVCELPCYALTTLVVRKGATPGPGSDLHCPVAEVAS